MSRWKLILVDTLIASDNEKEIDEIQKTIMEFFNIVVESVNFKKYE